MIELAKSPATVEPGAGLAGASAAGDWPGGDYHPEAGFFETLSEPFGSHALEVSVAGLSARLTGLSARQHPDLAARYGVFARRLPAGSPVDLEVEVRRSPRSGFLVLKRTGKAEVYRLLTRVEESRLYAWSYEWASMCDAAAKRGILAAASEDRVVFDRIVENFLRVSFAHLALQKGGILLHASGVVRNGRAYAFFGPSGAGKTTVTTLSGGSLILSDDLLLIAPDRTTGAWSAHSVPFRGLLTPGATQDRSWPLAGLFRLVQDDRNYLEPLSPPRGVGDLVQSLPFVTERPGPAARALDIVSDVAGAVPVRRLHFRKEAAFWEVLEHDGDTVAPAS